MTFEEEEEEGLWILNWFMRNGWYKGMRCGDNCERMEVREWEEWEGPQILGFLGLCGLVCFKLRFSVVRGSHIVLVLHI